MNEELNDIARKIDDIQRDLELLQVKARKIPYQLSALSSATELGKLLENQRQRLKIDLMMLSLQTGISVSTLRRLFIDPSKAKLGNVFAVAQELGVVLCFGE